MLGKFTSPAPALNKKQSSGGSSEADAALSTDGPAGGDGGGDSGLVAKLQELLLRERTAHAEAKNDLQVERDAHDDTAEKMVELQQRLEVTLQELSNLQDLANLPKQATPLLPKQTASQTAGWLWPPLAGNGAQQFLQKYELF